MRMILFAIVFLLPPFLKTHVLRLFAGADIERGVRIGWFSSVIGDKIFLGKYAEIRAFTLIRCSGTVEFEAYSAISNFCLVYGAFGLKVGKHCYIGPQCIINVDDEVIIGDYSGIGPRSMLFTHGSFLNYTKGYPAKFGAIRIGSRVWLPAGVFVHPGVTIGDDVLANSMTVIKKDVPSGKVIEGHPAKIVKETADVLKKLNPEDVDERIELILHRFSKIVLKREWRTNYEFTSPKLLSFTLKKRNYVIEILSTTDLQEEVLPSRQVGNNDIITIYLVHNSGFSFSPSTLYFNFTNMTMSRSRDKAFIELQNFLRRYYGERFSYDDESITADH